jgi:HEPN domain-containing protein
LRKVVQQLPDIKTPCSIIVHDVDYINVQLEEGQYFFSDLKKEGVLLYSSGNLRLREAAKQINLEQRYKLAQGDFEHWFTDAVGFYRTAISCIEKSDYRIAAFLMHQAAERSYNAILLVFARYKPKTHDLDTLRRLTNALDHKLLQAFPLNNAEEERLFKLLCNAYIDARYDKNYAITERELLWLAERIKTLQQLTEKLCLEKMQTFLNE